MSIQWLLAQTTSAPKIPPAFPASSGSGNIFSAAYWFGTSGGSLQATDTENLFMYILWVNIVSFVVLMVVMGWLVYKFRRGNEAKNYQVSPAHNTPMELTWSIVPLLVMVPIFWYGFTGYIEKVAAPSDAEVINIRGQKWNWTATYRNGAETQEALVVTPNSDVVSPIIYVPANRPVKLVMTSTDVIHAFYIPDFRTKMDVIPNRYTSMWFEAPLESDPNKNEHVVFCAEYCGDNHSEMTARIRVVSSEEYEAIIHKYATSLPPGEGLTIGKWVANRRGCFGCHSADGKAGTGPTWKNHYGAEHEYADGTKHVADDEWLRDNILNAQKHIVKGFPTSMPNFVGQIKPIEMEALLIYIRSLSDKTTQADIDAANAKFEESRAKKPEPKK